MAPSHGSPAAELRQGRCPGHPRQPLLALHRGVLDLALAAAGGREPRGEEPLQAMGDRGNDGFHDSSLTIISHH